MASLAFTGFDGKDYSFSSIPSSTQDYNYYFIVRFGNGAVRFVFFNESIEVYKDDTMLRIFADGSENGDVSTLFVSSVFFTPVCNEGLSINLNDNPVVIYSSDNLVHYLDRFNSDEGFYWDPFYTEPEEVSTFTLRPIVQEVDEKENILTSTFDEVFGILPVLITVLISFIGIRKGISFLISHLNKS